MKSLRFFGKNSNININGKTFIGNNVSINNNQVYIDGVLQGDIDDSKKVEITVLSDVDRIESDESITIKGKLNAKEVIARTSVNCDNIIGNVSAGTSVNCDDIKGNVTAGSSVNCDKVTGNATASRINY